MAGMISMALVRGDESAKVGENAQAKLLAFFRMELASEERIGRDARSERSAVIRRRRYDGAVVRNDVEGMNKIDIVAAGDSFQKRRVGFLFDAVPAHVRHFEIFAGAKAHNFSGKEIKPLLPSEFLALGKKQLEAETDAEEGFFLLHDLANRLDQAELAEIFHAGVESANTGQHDSPRRENLARIARHQGVEADALQALLHTAQIAHAVIDDRDHALNGLNVWNDWNSLNDWNAFNLIKDFPWSIKHRARED